MAVVVDTNVILHWLLDDDPKSRSRVVAFWNAVLAGEQEARVPECVFAETVFALQHHYGIERPTIAEHLTRLIGMKGVSVVNGEQAREALGLFASDAKLSFIDAFVICHAGEGQELMSLDAELNKVWKRRFSKNP